jgi:hypothetical protein
MSPASSRDARLLFMAFAEAVRQGAMLCRWLDQFVWYQGTEGLCRPDIWKSFTANQQQPRYTESGDCAQFGVLRIFKLRPIPPPLSSEKTELHLQRSLELFAPLRTAAPRANLKKLAHPGGSGTGQRAFVREGKLRGKRPILGCVTPPVRSTFTKPAFLTVIQKAAPHQSGAINRYPSVVTIR